MSTEVMKIEDNGHYYYTLYLSDGHVQLQRKQVMNGSDAPLNGYEEIIISLCKNLLSGSKTWEEVL